MEDSKQIKEKIEEVMILRVIATLLLLVLHSFTVYMGGWKSIDCIDNIVSYKWIAAISYSCVLELFVFISGYVLAWQLQRRQSAFISFVLKKAKRLLLPSLFFSILYILCLGTFNDGSFIAIINGVGHMWYLPMLFWTFVAGWLLHSMKCPVWIKLVICLLLCLISSYLNFLPFRIGRTCYYILFFYLGMVTFCRKRGILAWLTLRKIWGMLFTFLILFVSLTYFKEALATIQLTSFPLKFLRNIVVNCSTIAYSLAGVCCVYASVVYWLSNRAGWKPSPLLTRLNITSFGIYLFHQFILQFLYYHTSLPYITGTYLLPWVGFLITLVGSVFLSDLCLRTRLGRSLIG